MSPPDYSDQIAQLEEKYSLPSGSLKSLVQTESGGNPAARSPVGAIGLTQLMPDTAKGLGVDPTDPVQNLEGGAKYLSQNLKQFGSLPLAYAAYNAGPGRVKAAGNQTPEIPETRNYVDKNMKNMFGSMMETSSSTNDPLEGEPKTSEDALQPTILDADARDPSKKSWKDKILPLVFRIGLPTVAGAALGARDPFRGAFASALTGAASGGLGYLNEEDKEKAAAMELQKLQAKAGVETAKTKAKVDQENKVLDFQNRKLQYDQQFGNDKLAHDIEQDKVKNNLAQLEYERQVAKDKADAKARAEKEKNEKMNPEDKIYKFLSDQMNGKPIDPKNQAQVQSLIDNLQTKDIKDLMTKPDSGILASIFGGGEAKVS